MSEDKKVWYLDKMNLFIKQLPCQLKNALVSVICHFSSFNFGVMNLSLQIFYFFFCRLFSEVWKKYNHRIHTPTTVERLPSVAHVVLDVFYTYCWYWLLVVCFKFLSLLNAKRDLRILTGNTLCLLSLSTEKLRSFYRFPWLEFLCLIVRNPAVFHFGVTSCNGHGKQSVSNWK